jgi:hypothetical protein
MQSFDEIWQSKQAEIIRERVRNCKKGCWMVGSARPAMRSHPLSTINWILKNKIKIMLHKQIDLN